MGDWSYIADADLDPLFVSIDNRTSENELDGSLLGVWFEAASSQDRKLADRAPQTLCAIYNIDRVALDLSDAFGVKFEDGPSNFLPGLLNTVAYWQAHSGFSPALQAKFGYSLEAVVGSVWGLSNLAMFSDALLVEKSEEKREALARQALVRLLQRGYQTFSADNLVERIAERLSVALFEFTPDRNDLARAIGRLTLQAEAQAGIGLWSGGPRHPIVRWESYYLADLEAIPMLLVTLFAFVSHDATARGGLFEATFRRAIQKKGFDCKSGELRALTGLVRELDAGVSIGNQLFLFECVSVERPLDYEIGNPKTVSFRQERLSEKVDQALALAEFVRSTPRGTNYDFADATTIVPLVVSPFVEWSWNRSDKLWVDENTPRIMSAREALHFLAKQRAIADSPGTKPPPPPPPSPAP